MLFDEPAPMERSDVMNPLLEPNATADAADGTDWPQLTRDLDEIRRLVIERTGGNGAVSTRLSLMEDKVDRLLDVVEGNGHPPILAYLTAIEKDVAQLQESVALLRRIVYSVAAFLLVALFELFRNAVFPAP
jgi:hypothetical protein